MPPHARPRPKRLAVKLLAIRQRLGLSQSQMAKRLSFNIQRSAGRISEYERGTREPSLMLLLAYARVAKVRLEKIVDDELDI